MIRHLLHTEIDKTKWDDCLKSSPQGIVYAASWYLDIVSPQWEALVENDYEYIFPLCSRSKYGFSYLFQPHFTQQGGLFSSHENITEKKLLEFINAIPKKFKLIEINLNSKNIISENKDLNVFKRRTHHLQFERSIELIRKNYSENLRRNIRKAETYGQQIERTKDIQPLIKIFRNGRGKSIGQLGEKEYQTLSLLTEKAFEKNSVEIIISKNKNGEIIAGAVFIHSFSSYIFLFSATTDEGKLAGSMSMIIDLFIEKHRLENKLLDFEGSMNDDLSRFYRNFGSEEIVYLQIRKNTLPIPFRWFK